MKRVNRVLIAVLTVVLAVGMMMPAFAASKKTIWMPTKITVKEAGDDSTMSVNATYKYNKKGELLSDVLESPELDVKIKSKYNWNDKRTKIVSSSEKTYIGGELFDTNKATYVYKNKYVIKVKYNGKLSSYKTIKNGRIVKVREYTEGKVDKVTTYKYKSGKLKSAKEVSNGKTVNSKFKTTYKNGRLKKMVETYGDSKITYTITYKKFRVTKKQYNKIKRQTLNFGAVVGIK